METTLRKQLENENYTNLKEIPGRGVCGLWKFLFTTGLCFGLDQYGYVGRYCYETTQEAEIALKYWDGVGDPPGFWLKYKGEGGDRSNHLFLKSKKQVK